MTGMGKKRELRTHWQRVARLVLAKEDVLTVSRARAIQVGFPTQPERKEIPEAGGVLGRLNSIKWPRLRG
jgi:hypothetical protein